MSTAPSQSPAVNHIECTPGIRGGKPRVKGTRITVSDVVLWNEQGMSPDEIITEFPGLTLADVFAALAYYHDNQTAIDQQIRDTREYAEQMKAQIQGQQS